LKGFFGSPWFFLMGS